MKLVNLPVIYQAEVIFPRGRKVRTENFYTTVPVEIQERTIHTAPIVSLIASGPVRPECIRFDGDTFLKPVMNDGHVKDNYIIEDDYKRIQNEHKWHVDYGVDKRIKFDQILSINPASDNQDSVFDVLKMITSEHSFVTESNRILCYKDDTDVKTRISDTKEGAIKKVNNTLQNYTFIGDSLYERIPLPYVRMGRYKYDDKNKDHLTVKEYERDSNLNYFPVPINLVPRLLAEYGGKEKTLDCDVKLIDCQVLAENFDANTFAERFCHTLKHNILYNSDYLADYSRRKDFQNDKNPVMNMLDSIIKKSEFYNANLDDLIMLGDVMDNDIQDPDFFAHNNMMSLSKGIQHFVETIKDELAHQLEFNRPVAKI